jgi:hypothetical protein
MVESARWKRFRWRRRGAWQWPAFAALTVVDALLIGLLPFHGSPDPLGAAILAGFFNVLAVALLAPLAGMLLRRHRRDLPVVVARDYAGTVLLAGVTFALLAGGLADRSARAHERRNLQAVQLGVHNYVVAQAPRFEVGLATMDTVKLDASHYRACVYDAHERLPLCLFVNTDQVPAGVARDPSREPNTGLSY